MVEYNLSESKRFDIGEVFFGVEVPRVALGSTLDVDSKD
jgi:hypothetical protein